MSADASSTGKRGRGRPPLCPRELVIRMFEMRQGGLSYANISAALNAAQVPTPTDGSCWQKSMVDRVLHTRYAERIRKELYDEDD